MMLDKLSPPTEDVTPGKSEDGRAYTGVFVVATHDGRVCGTFALPVDSKGIVSAESIVEQLESNCVEPEPTFAPPIADQPRISVVVGVTDGGRRVARAIDSILAGGYENAEVIVVNNRPANGPVVLDPSSASASDPRVKLVDQAKAGLSAARNRGAAEATGEILLFTDDDVVAMHGMLSATASAFFDYPAASCVTGLILPLKLETESQARIERFAGFSKGFERTRFRLDENEDDRTFPFAAGQFGSGANIAITKKAFDELGGFDETLGTGTAARGGEDTDLFIRLMLEGYELVYEPASAVLHEHPDTPAQLRSMVYNYGVGTTAVTAKQLFFGNHRRRLMRAIPAGLMIALSPGSAKNQRKGKEFPLSYTLRELSGMVSGPLAYLRSRRENDGVSSAAPVPQNDESFTPAWVCEIELSQKLAVIDSPPLADGSRFGRAHALVRLDGTPIGFADVPLTEGRARPAAIAAAVGTSLGNAIGDELKRLGLGSQMLTSAGIVEAAGLHPAPAATPLVSVIICTRDHPEQFGRAMDSVLAIDYPNFELIVIDNAPSDDGTRTLVERRADPRVHYFLEPIGGLGRARNRGLVEADGEIIAFTDDDVEVDAGWINGLLEGFANGSKVGLVTGIVVSTALENEFQQYFDDQVQWSDNFAARLYDLGENRADHVMYPYASGMLGTGANFAMSAAAVSEIGPFDEALGAGMPTRGGEDLDYFLRMLTTNDWQVSYEPRALVWHHHRSDEPALRAQMFGYGSGAMAYGFKTALDPHHSLTIIAKLAHMLQRRLAGDNSYSFETGHGELRKIQRDGLLRGPWLYIKSRWQIRGRAPAARTRD